MERIVLGFDGSPASVAALHWTAARAARAVTRVDVLNVNAPSPLTVDGTDGLRLLAEAERSLRERLPGGAIALHSLDGTMPQALAEFAGSADLVVIGVTNGHPLRAALAGFMPLRLSIHSQAPVCMVPAGYVVSNDPVTVGVAADASSDPAVAFAAREAVATQTSLRLVHAWLMPKPTFRGSAAIAPALDTEVARHNELVDAARERVRIGHPFLPVDAELVRDSRSAALLRFAPASSLLVIGTHHRGPVAGGLLGSVAQGILWRTECPVCIVPEEK